MLAHGGGSGIVVWLSGSALAVNKFLYTPGPVNTWTGDCLRAGMLTFSILNKKAQLTQGLRATALYYGCQPPSWILSNRKYSAIRSPDTEKPNLEPNMECIGCTVCGIFAFKLYCDLETGVRGHSRSSKAALFDRAHTNLYSSRSFIVCYVRGGHGSGRPAGRVGSGQVGSGRVGSEI